MQARTLALSGLFQAVACVDSIASTGQCDEQALQVSINSLYQIDAESTAAVYGGVNSLKLGQQKLADYANRLNDEHLQLIVRYAMTLILLEKQLQKQPEKITLLQTRVARAQQQRLHFGDTHSHMLQTFADIYSDTYGQLKFRLQVMGNPAHLQQPNKVNMVRALLLAGIRSVVLWRQLGGKLHQLIFFKHQLRRETRNLLSHTDY